MRRLVGTATTTLSVWAAVATLMGLGAGPAAAAPEPCPASLSVPSRISVAAANTTIPASLALRCSPFAGAVQYNVVGGSGQVLSNGSWLYRFGPTVQGPARFTDSGFVPGVYAAVGQPGDLSGQPDHPDGYTLVWGSAPRTLIKFGGNGGIASGRRGSVVTILGLFHEYRPGGFVRPVGRTEYLQRWVDGTGWQTIAAVPTGGDGRTAISFVSTTVTQYRWVSVDNPLTFAYTTLSAFV